MLHVKADEVTKLEGPGRGLTVIKTSEDDMVIGFIAGRKADSFEIKTEKSGKKFTLTADPKQAGTRGGKGHQLMPSMDWPTIRLSAGHLAQSWNGWLRTVRFGT